MKISCLPVSLFSDITNGKLTLAQWIKGAKKIGYNGVDVSMLMLRNHTPAFLNEVKAMLREEQIPIIMATTYPDFTHPSRQQRERELIYLQRDIALCEELGIRYLRVLAGQAHPETGREEGVNYAVKYLTLADAFTDRFKVKLLYENHAKPGAWERVDFSYPVDIFMEVFQGIIHTDIRLNFDIGNLVSLNVDPLTVLEKVYPRVETIHISDMAEAGRFSPVTIGTGVAPITEVLSWLKQRGFDGWLCIEEASNTGFDGIRTAYDFVKNAWNQA